MFEIHSVSNAPCGETYLLTDENVTYLVDTGFAYYAKEMVSNIEKVLGDRELDCILLTHSHYDHASGTAECLKRWPNAKVVASEYAAYVFSRPTAIKLMREMNENAAMINGGVLPETDFTNFKVDVIAHDNMRVQAGDFSLTAIATPGHTKCCMSYYWEKYDLLIAAETLGLPSTPGVVKPCYLVSYKNTVQSIERCKTIRTKNLLVSHYGLLTGERCDEFLNDSLYWAQEMRRRVVNGHLKGKPTEQLIEEFVEFYREADAAHKKPEKATRLNSSIAVPMLIKEYEADNK